MLSGCWAQWHWSTWGSSWLDVCTEVSARRAACWSKLQHSHSKACPPQTGGIVACTVTAWVLASWHLSLRNSVPWSESIRTCNVCWFTPFRSRIDFAQSILTSHDSCHYACLWSQSIVLRPMQNVPGDSMRHQVIQTPGMQQVRGLLSFKHMKR